MSIDDTVRRAPARDILGDAQKYHARLVRNTAAAMLVAGIVIGTYAYVHETRQAPYATRHYSK